ncbi:hypothetical protein [Dyella nitratireducens]|uniref:hypothetical protein n=1 Tax=Dyella nitratireducens TaxID=1849580 RepID=UPI001E2B92E4|nr:hypothetical protein [Dyella nitratireducens]
MSCWRISHHKIERIARIRHLKTRKHTNGVMRWRPFHHATFITLTDTVMSQHCCCRIRQMLSQATKHIGDIFDMRGSDVRCFEAIMSLAQGLRFLADHCDADHSFDGWPAMTV